MAPARSSARRADRSVAPVVTTSSTRSTDRPVNRRPRPEGRPGEPLTARPTRLGVLVARPIEQTARRHTELAADVPGDELGLVESSRPPSRRARRRPGDDVDAVVVAVGDDGVDDEAGEVSSHLTTVAVLQPEHHVAGATGERERRVDPVRPRPRAGAEQRESAGGTYGDTRGVATGTTSLEHHAASVTTGCHRVPRPNPRHPTCDE